MKVKEAEIVIKSDCLLRFACSDVFFYAYFYIQITEICDFCEFILIAKFGCLWFWMSRVLDVSGAGCLRVWQRNLTNFSQFLVNQEIFLTITKF